jgi:hypothetical protein
MDLVHTVPREVEQSGQILGCTVGMTRIGEAGIGVTELIKEWLTHRFDRRQALGGSVF